MTIPAEISETVYSLSGTLLGPLQTNFTCEALTDVVVRISYNSGPWTVLASGTDYSISGATPATSGGNVTLHASLYTAQGLSAWPANTKLHMYRATNTAQGSAFGEATGFSPEAAEAAIDHVERVAQDAATRAARALVTFPGESGANLPPASIRANMLLEFDSAGKPVTIRSAAAISDSAQAAVQAAASATAAGNSATAASSSATAAAASAAAASGASIPANSVDNTKLAQMPAATIKGNASGSSANAGDLTPTQVAAMVAPQIPAASITNAMLGSMAALTIKGNKESTTGAPEDLSVAQVQAMLGANADSLCTLATITGSYGVDLSTATSKSVHLTNAGGHNIANLGACVAGAEYSLTFADHVGIIIDNDQILGPNAVGYQYGGDGLAPQDALTSGFNSLPCWPGDTLRVRCMGPTAATGGKPRWQVMNYMPWHLFSFMQQGISGDVGSLSYTYAVGPRGKPLGGGMQDYCFVDGFASLWANGAAKFIVPSLVIRGGNDAAGKVYFEMANSQLGVSGTGASNSPLKGDGELLPISNITKDGTTLYFQAFVDDPAHPGHVRKAGADVGFFAGHSPSMLAQGCPMRLTIRCTETPTVNGTGGTMVFGPCKKGTTTNIDRAWFDDIGNWFVAGAAALEAAQNANAPDATGIGWTWPFDTHWSSTSPLGEQPQKWGAPSGDCNWLDTQGWGNVSIVATNINDSVCRNNAALAMRAYGNHGLGWDLGWDGVYFGQYRVNGGTRTRFLRMRPDTGEVMYEQTPVTLNYSASGSVPNTLTLANPNDVAGNGVGLSFQIGTNTTNTSPRIKAVNEDGAGNGGFEWQTSRNAPPQTRMKLWSTGVLQLSAYGQGMLQTQPDGTVVQSNILSAPLQVQVADNNNGLIVKNSTYNLGWTLYPVTSNAGVDTDLSIFYIGPGGGGAGAAMRFSGADKSASAYGVVKPAVDNAYSLGAVGARWSQVYAATGTINTSDQRAKTAIAPCALGLDFINALTPRSYKYLVGGQLVSYPPDQIDPETGEPAKAEPTVTPLAGVRTHYGLIAQEVKAVLDGQGVTDFGGWVLTDMADPASEQGLRYEEFISPLIKAVQQLSAQVVALQAQVAALTPHA